MDDDAPLIAFTIAARNYIPYATSLHRSLQQHHPGIQFFLGLSDVREGFDEAALDFALIDLAMLRDIRIWAMAERYNATEFCTAIKPFLFLHLMARHPGHRICYFDPDIWVMSPMTELRDALDGGAQMVLTPHLLTPTADPARFPDQTMLTYGTYNLGFLAVRDSPETRAVMRWWADRLETQCIIDLANGLFVDQKWADMFPALLDRVHVLRHPGYNIAYWNVMQRRVRWDGSWTVTADGFAAAPVRFVHFSGYSNFEPGVFSRHARYLDHWVLHDLALLLPLFRERLLQSGFEAFSRFRYAFGWLGQSGANLHTPEELAERALGPAPFGRDLMPLPSINVQSWADWKAQRDAAAPALLEQRATERALEPDVPGPFSTTGICSMCRIETRFDMDYTYALEFEPGALTPNWRENCQCSCGFITRIRGAMHVLQTVIQPAPGAAIYVTEAVTPLFRWLRLRWPNTIGSEFFSPSHVPGRLYDGVRHEDICRLTFAGAQFDAVLSFDVLEHVVDLDAALRECFRVLKPGGTLLFTAPTQFDHGAVVELVEILADGSYNFLRPPEYHGNPVNPDQGSLAFRYLGLDALDRLRAVGFEHAEAAIYWSQDAALLGRHLNLFLARKAA